MPANKAHHFVPQFYLRNFSADGSSVGTFVLKKNRFVESASISGQCQRAYFYGRDQVREKSFKSFEDEWAPIFKDIISSREAFSVFTPEHLFFLLFVVMQKGRTVAAAHELEEMSDKMAKAMLAPVIAAEGIDPGLLEHYRIGPRDAVTESLANFTKTWPLLTDLRPILLIDTDAIGFITGDHPVIYANQLLQSVTDRGVIGAQSPGLQIFVPLSPSVMLLLYDEDAYGTGKRSPSVVEISSGDIEQINALQVVTAEENIYFNSQASSRAYIFDLVKKYGNRRPDQRATVEFREHFVQNDLEYANTHIVFSRLPKIDLNLACLKTLKKGLVAATAWKAKPTVRKPKLVSIYQEFERQVERGERKGSDMLRFVIDATNTNA